MKKTRWILQTLILSVALNVVLLLIFFYFILWNDSANFTYKTKEEIIKKEPPLTSTFLSRLRSLDFNQLSELIKDQRSVEHGYRVGDFAIGVLASFFDFDVERGLGQGKLSKRIWEFSGEQFLLYPGLKEEDLETLYHFATHDKWPLTPKGLFHSLHQIGIEEADSELIHYFCHAPHFILLETLFVRTQTLIQKKDLLSLILESGWDWLNTFYNSQKEATDFSNDARRALLREAFQKDSKMAVHLFIVTDSLFVLKTASDEEVLKMLDLLEIVHPEIEHFVHLIAHSPRSESVCNKALKLLVTKRDSFEAVQEDVHGQSENIQAAFLKERTDSSDVVRHIVQSGESLWSISKKYRVSVQALIKENHLQTEVIQSGKSLSIPLP